MPSIARSRTTWPLNENLKVTAKAPDQNTIYFILRNQSLPSRKCLDLAPTPPFSSRNKKQAARGKRRVGYSRRQHDSARPRLTVSNGSVKSPASRLHPVGRSRAVAARSARRSRRRSLAHRSVAPHLSQRLDLPSPALDAGELGLCRESAGPALLCARRARALSRSCLPAAGRSAAQGAGPYRPHQHGHRRDRASGGAAGRQHRHAGEARSAPRGACRYRHGRPKRCAARDRDRQGDDRLAAGGSDPPHGRRPTI